MSKIKNALISVSDKSDLRPLVEALQQHNVQIYSTGGTARFLREDCGAECQEISELTQFPELMEGRVKTLHPKVFGGVLARRETPSDLDQCKSMGIPLFDLVVVNLYPFAQHLDKSTAVQSGFVDIGGPSLLRAAAKNHHSVTPISDTQDYGALIEELKTHDGATSEAFRKKMAAKTFQRTASYDQLIAQTWADDTSALPEGLRLAPQQKLRYGENPHQEAAWCGEPSWSLLQGKALSYNNLLDAEAATRVAQEFQTPCICIVKHNNPCGVAIGDEPLVQVFKRAFEADSQSAFGGIVATNTEIDEDTASAMKEIFLEVVLAPRFSNAAKSVLSQKKNLRLIEWNQPTAGTFEVRQSLGGWLLQSTDSAGKDGKDFKTVTKSLVPESLFKNLHFAWLVAKHVRSNAIVLARDLTTLGIGAGQMSRVDAVRIALEKCDGSVEGAVLASDAFFPFRDNIDLLKGKKMGAIIQPGGSVRDSEVIEACEEQGIPMVFTGERHFRH